MATPYYLPEGNVPLPPADADVITTACDYCIVACGYKVYRWPVKGGKSGGMAANENAFGEQFPVMCLAHGSHQTSITWLCIRTSHTTL